jgi:cytochrome oxidase Cu insertion factor (SCO1/SenC/PrrC family)
MKMLAIFAAIIAVLVAAMVVRARHIGAKAPSSGMPAPDFTLNSQDGKSLSLRDLRGKWVVLYF